MNCKLNIKADNGANSKLYLDILDTVKNPKQAVDMYFYTKTPEFKKFYTGKLDENEEPIYSEFSKEAYINDVDYNNIELEKSAEVYKKLLEDVPALMDVISSRISYLHNVGTKEHVKQLSDLYDVLESQPINTSIPRFIEMAKGHVFNLRKITEKEAALNDFDIKKLAGYYKTSQSYSIISDLKQALTLSPEVHKIFDENVNSMTTVIDNINTIENLYINKSIEYLANEFHKRDNTWSKRQIKEELHNSPRDILWTEHMLEYMGDSRDRVLSMVASVMMEAEHTKRRQMIDFNKDLEKVLAKVESKHKSKDVFDNLIVEGANGELHIVDLNAKFTGGKSKLSDMMYKKLQELKNEPELLEFLEFYHNTMQNLEARLPMNARLGTRIPTVLRSEFELLEGKTGKEKVALLKDNMTKKIQRSNLDMEKGLLSDASGKPVKRIPTFYTKRYDSADYDLQFKKIKDKLLAEGLEEEKAEDQAHVQAKAFAIKKMSSLISRDLASSLQAFNAMAVNYATKNELITIFESAEAVVGSKYRTYNLVDSGGRTIVDKMTGRIKTISGEKSVTAKLLSTFLEMQLYGQKEKDLGFVDVSGYKVDVNKVFRAINKYTGFTMQAGNILSGISNFATGEINNLLEVAAKEYFNKTDYVKASGMYKDNLFGIINDIGARTPSNIINLLEGHYNLLQSFGGEKMKTSERTKARRLMKSNAAYFIQESGEHALQIRASLAFMNNIHLFDKNGNDKGSLLDNHTVKDDKLQVPSNLFIKGKDGNLTKFNTQQQNRISNKIGAVLRKVHGNYSTITAAKVQQDARTAMMAKFRGWMYEGIKRRYGKKRDYYMLETEMEGFYRTGWKALGVLVKDLKSLSLQMSKENWRTLTPHEKANIRRMVTETSAIIATAVAGALLANAGKMMDDRFDTDDPGDRAILGAYAMLNYQVNRLYTEIFAYMNPQEALKLLATPAASVSIAENTTRLITQIIGDPLEQYKVGWRKGDYKVLVRAEKLIPLYKQIQTLNADGIKDRGAYFVNN